MWNNFIENHFPEKPHHKKLWAFVANNFVAKLAMPKILVIKLETGTLKNFDF